jgi:hypothetical protein
LTLFFQIKVVGFEQKIIIPQRAQRIAEEDKEMSEEIGAPTSTICALECVVPGFRFRAFLRTCASSAVNLSSHQG